MFNVLWESSYNSIIMIDHEQITRNLSKLKKNECAKDISNGNKVLLNNIVFQPAYEESDDEEPINNSFKLSTKNQNKYPFTARKFFFEIN